MKISTIFVWASLFGALAQSPQPAAVTGIPYSADRMQEHAGATGSYLIGHFFRDSQGRTRTESALKSSPAWSIEILDPVAGISYNLDDKNKIAYRTHTLGTVPRPYAPPNARIENLGAQVIEGVLAVGTRTSSALTIETWDSIELHVNMLTKSSNGYTSRLVNLKRADPDPALFRPPADYTVVDR